MMNRTSLTTLLVILLALHSLSGPSPAQPPATVTVKLVSDFASAKPISELEEIRPITTMRFDSGGSREEVLGERCVLWARNAHVDGKFFFERYFQDKYIG